MKKLWFLVCLFLPLYSIGQAFETQECQKSCGGGGPTETSFTKCTDGIDNDNDNKIDCQDSGCYKWYICGGDLYPENTLQRCSDGIDNDGDGKIDCADSGCYEFTACPSLCDVHELLEYSLVGSNRLSVSLLSSAQLHDFVAGKDYSYTDLENFLVSLHHVSIKIELVSRLGLITTYELIFSSPISSWNQEIIMPYSITSIEDICTTFGNFLHLLDGSGGIFLDAGCPSSCDGNPDEPDPDPTDPDDGPECTVLTLMQPKLSGLHDVQLSFKEDDNPTYLRDGLAAKGMSMFEAQLFMNRLAGVDYIISKTIDGQVYSDTIDINASSMYDISAWQKVGYSSIPLAGEYQVTKSYRKLEKSNLYN